MSWLSKLVGSKAALPSLDYDQLVLLDAEDLAEQGLREAYEALLPALRAYIPEPAEVVEDIDDNICSYRIRCGSFDFVVYSPELPGTEEESWGRATYALFELVNRQLGGAGVRFYAINGGNDLGGMFLTPTQAEEAKKSLSRKSDWPYLPNLEPPYYGQQA